MGRPTSETLTKREAEVMHVLWDRGGATAEAVRSSLSDGLHDSTVRTLLRVLEAKGYVRHSVSGKAYVFRPAVKRSAVERSAVQGFLLTFFRGSAEALVLRLLEDEHLGLDDLESIVKRERKSPRG